MARDYRREYQRRIARGLERGRTRQQARGHIPREHVRRKERERIRAVETGGLTSLQRQTVRRWVIRRHPYMNGEIADLYDWIGGDYNKFLMYRHANDNLHNEYVGRGYYSQGLDLFSLYSDVEDIDNLPDEKWRFYH